VLRSRAKQTEVEAERGRLRELLRVARAALWEADPETGSMVVLESGGGDEMFGYPREVWQQQESRAALRHPDDVVVGRENLARLLAGEVEQVSYETRIRDGAGWRLLQHTATLGPSKDGRTVFRGLTIDVTSQRRQRDIYRALFDSTAVGVVVCDGKRTLLEANDAYCRIVGRTREEILGESADGFTLGFDPAPAELRRLAAGEIDQYTVEKRYVRPDGSTVWVRVTGSPISRAEDRYVAVVEDLSERDLAEQQLHEKAALLERAHAAARLGSYSADLVARRVMVSRELAHVLGASADAFEIDADEFGRRFVPEEHIAPHAEAIDAARTHGGPLAFHTQMRKADGSYIHARVYGNVEIDEAGTAVREIGVIQDVSDEHALEEQLRQSQKLEAVGQLAGGVAHDFNNLLTVIAGNAQLTLMSSDDEKVLEDTRELLRATERASQLVRQLLAFSRYEATEAGAFELNEVVEEVAGMLGRLIEENVELEIDLDEDDLAVLADRGGIEQVLLNLAVNARDAMPHGGRLSIRTRRVDESALIAVSDDGVGMDERTRERIFEPFFTTKARGEGTGLGLSTVYGIVIGAGGSIQVDSEPGLGTTFTILLPVAAAGELAEDVPKPRGLVHGAGERVLLVEDEPMVRSVAAEILTRAGYATMAVGDGEEALQLIDEGERFDVLVSDFMMPKLNGLQLADELEARGVTMPIVYTSGYSAGLELQDRLIGHAGFVAKPFSGEALTAAVRRQLDGEHRPA
jgi:two-component system, cell cycle sensor histidine kinase and response regulator CckA